MERMATSRSQQVPTPARRSRTTRRAASQQPDHGADDRTLSAEGPSGTFRIVLERSGGGLYVEREDHPRGGVRTAVSIEFRDKAAFDRWWDEDRQRFDHPLLHQRVRRAAADLWGEPG